MADLTSEAFAVLRQQHGHATVLQLAEAGVNRNSRRRLVEERTMTVLSRSVLRINSAPVTFDSRCVGLCLTHPRGFITGPSGGRLRGLRRMPATDLIYFRVPHGVHLHDADIVLRQSRNISPLDSTRLESGIVVASAPRLAFDLAVDLSPLDLASVIEQVLQRRMCTMAGLGATARRLCHPRRPGSEAFAKALLARGDRPAADSHPEVVLAEALRARSVPVEPQYKELRLFDGRRVRIDLAVPALRWGIEIDVHPDHLLLDGTTKDKGRDRQCHLIGWQIERVTEIDLLDLDGIVDELVALYRTRTDLAA